MTQIERNEMIYAIVDSMDSWDIDTLITWAKEARREQLIDLEDEDIENCYRMEVTGEW